MTAKKEAPKTAATVNSAKVINNQDQITIIPPEIQEIPGLSFTGNYIRGLKPSKAPIPLYEIAPPADGKPSINTLEGWNQMLHDTAALSAERKLGRKPTERETQAEIAWNAEESRHIIQEAGI